MDRNLRLDEIGGNSEMRTIGEKREPLYYEAKREILRAVESGQIATDGKLPSESELCSLLSVSRSTVRSALQLLEADGIISVRHGKGSYLNYAAAQSMRMRIDLAKGFFNLIVDSGHTPSIAHSEMADEALPGDVARTLLLPQGAEAHVLRRLFLGDGIPAFYVTEYLPAAYFKTLPESAAMPESVFEIARQHCVDKIEYANMSIGSALLTEELSQKMQLEVGRSVLLLNEVHYSKENKPLAYSSTYVNDSLIRFQVRRKKA